MDLFPSFGSPAIPDRYDRSGDPLAALSVLPARARSASAFSRIWATVLTSRRAAPLLPSSVASRAPRRWRQREGW